MNHFLTRMLVALALAAATGAPANAQNIAYPSDCAVVHNVVTEFGATGNGTTDDTRAIEDGLARVNGTYQVLYFPNGTYRISRMLEVSPWTILQGQSEAGTVVKLQTACSGYGSKSTPRPMLRTHVGEPGGGMNMQFNIYLNNMTFNTGSGNPGAIGVRFIANNGGGLDHVTVVADDNDGYCGIDLTAAWDGPQYSHHLTVRGFDYGICVGSMHYATTLEYVNLSGQKVAGIQHYMHPTTIRKLTSVNTVPAIINDNPYNAWDNPLLVLLDSDLRGGSATVSAIQHRQGHLFVRHVTSQGYRSVIDSLGTAKGGASVDEYTTMPAQTLFGGRAVSLDLPIDETLDMPWDPLDQWANVRSYQNLVTNNDWGPAIQAAIASGKTTVYFPGGQYTVNSTVTVGGDVRVFQGMGAGLTAGSSISRTRPMFRIADGSAPAVFFDQLSFEGNGAQAIHVEHTSSRAVAVKHSRWLMYQSKSGAGRLFVDDCSGSLYYFDYPQKVFLRALNLEGNSTTLFNNAADLVVLNHKTEGLGASIRVSAGSRTEILGGLNYPANPNVDGQLAYINDGGEMTIVQLHWWSQTTCVSESRVGVTRTVPRSEGCVYLFYAANYGSNSVAGAPRQWSVAPQPAQRSGIVWLEGSRAEGVFTGTLNGRTTTRPDGSGATCTRYASGWFVTVPSGRR